MSETRPTGACRISKSLIIVDGWHGEPVSIFWSIISFSIETLLFIPAMLIESPESRRSFDIWKVPIHAGSLNVNEESDGFMAAERCKPASATAGSRIVWSLIFLWSESLSCLMLIFPRQMPQTSCAMFLWNWHSENMRKKFCIISSFDCNAITGWRQVLVLVCVCIEHLDTVQMLKISDNPSHSKSMRSDPSVPSTNGISSTMAWKDMHSGNKGVLKICLVVASSSKNPAAGKIGIPAIRWSQKYE